MFQISNQWLLFLLDVSTKALLLAVVAGIALKLLKLRDSNIRHRVWSGVLAGMLLLPVLALVLPTIPLAIPAGWTNFESPVEPAHLESMQVASNDTITSGHPYANSPLENREMPASLPESVLPPTSQDQKVVETVNTTVTVSNKGTTDILPAIPGVLFLFWIAVSLTFALRLVIGLWSSTKLLRRAVVVDGPRIQDCLAALPTALLRRVPTIRESSEVLVPVTVGWLRPTVLLPEEWQTWTHEKLSAIVAHEFTHVARRDFFVTLAAELNRCLYWFHPVSWWLRSRLSDLAEEACDDAAISHTGDRTGYARRVQPGVSMTRESNVESRITTILDFKRPLSQRLTWRSATAIALIAIPVIIAAAAVRPATAIATPDKPPVATASADIDINVAPATDTETVHIRGQVTDTNAQPIPNARVRLYRMGRPEWYAGIHTATLLTELEVDSEGRFDQTIAKDKIIQATKKPMSWRHLPQSQVWWTTLVVSAPNYAYSTFGAQQGGPIIKGKSYISPGFLDQPFTVQLRPAVTIRGRLLSIEGQPVAGASVSVYQFRRPHASRFDTWLQQTSKVPLPKSSNRAMMLGGPVSQDASFPADQTRLPHQCIQPVVTNSAGIFELPGLAAKDDLVVLRIKGKSITDTVIHVLAREMKPVYGHHSASISSSGAYYGRTFDFITQPSVPVYGVVRDIETKVPLAGIPVAVEGVYGATMSHEGYITTQTDEQGRYRIEGLPVPPVGTRRYKRNRLTARPGKLPYIETDSLSVPPGDGLKPVEFNIELRRAVLAKGRLTNKATGAPIASAEISYTPYKKNENCENYLRYADGSMRFLGNDSRYYSDKDGYFSIPVIPGRGVIGARIKAGEYISGYGAEKIEAYHGKDPSELPSMLSDHLVPSLFHSLKEIDVPVGSSEFELSMYVDAGESLTVNFINPQGDPVKGVEGTGLSSTYHQWKSIKDDHAKATGLAVGVIRPMHFSDKAAKLTRFMRLIPEEGQTHFTITLLPPSRLTGRLIDPEGRPLANAFLDTRHQNDPSSIASLPHVQTDKQGRFDYPLPTGTSYQILTVIGDEYFIVVKELKNPEPKNIDLGDLVLDPDAEAWAISKAKREPVITDLVSAAAEDTATDSSTKDETD